MGSFQPTRVAIVCSTYYPTWYQGKLRSIHHTDKIRGDLALEFITKAARLGYHVVVADGFSTKIFQKHLRAIDVGVVVIKRKKENVRSQARKLTFSRAADIAGIQAIVYSEPEKVSLLESVPAIVNPLLTKTADIIVPKREAKSFKETYPLYQQSSEEEGNILYNELLHIYGLLPEKQSLDIFFGPCAFALNKEILTIFKTEYRSRITSHVLHADYYQPHNFSDALYFSIVMALKKKLRVKSIPVSFRYPVLQKQNEDVGERAFFEEKRKTQKLTFLVELIHFLKYLEKKMER